MEKIVVSCLESRMDENQSVYSRFLLGPFISGHAVTVATALRRALLSEVKNIAITALHFQGVTHEFSTVVGIRESVLELSLNFQQIILSTQTKPKSVQIGYLHVQGPAIVHANDLKLPDGIECVNPTQYIATLSTEGLLVVKFLIGGKKSFLKSNTSTLNSKKIKEAKAYSAQLSQSLLSHAEYDPPRVFRLLRNQSLPNGSIARRAIEEANLLRAGHRRDSSEQSKGPLGPDQIAFGNLRTGRLARASSAKLSKSTRNPFDKNKATSPALGESPSEPNLVLKEQDLIEPSSTRVGSLTGSTKPTQKADRTALTAGSVGHTGLEPDLEVARLTDQRRDMSIIDADSNLDQSANRISDEFNSEVCLRTIIPLDPIFTPVYQVNFGIERDDLSNQIRERVIMEVWTNGSIHPRQAINEAALSTMSIFSKLRKTFQVDSHSLALSAKSTIPAAGFANRNVVPGRGSRLHKTKSFVKSGLLNDDATESLGSLARSAVRSLVLSPSGQLSRPCSRSEHSARVARPSVLAERYLATAGPNKPKAPQALAVGEVWTGPVRAERGALAVHLLRTQSVVDSLSFGQEGGFLACTNRPGTRERFARVVQERRGNFRRFALAKPSVTKLDLTNLVGSKFKSFSTFGFVRSRHPVSVFLQNFGKSHIQGQAFISEQSFGLKARFFKGHCAVLLKAKHTSDDQTSKRTFLPSFKVLLGLADRNVVPACSASCSATLKPGASKSYARPTEQTELRSALGANRSRVPSTTKAILPSLTRRKPEQNRAGLTKAQLLFQLRFCLAGAVFQGLPLSCSYERESLRSKASRYAPFGRIRPSSPSKNSAVGRLSRPTSCPPAWFDRLSESGQVACSASGSAKLSVQARVHNQKGCASTSARRASKSKQPKPILFLIKYRTFSFTKNALSLFGCKQEDSSFLLPLAKQLIRLKMARVFTSCLPLMSKRSEPSLRFRFTETQAMTTVEGSGRFNVKQILLSLAQSAFGLQNNSCGSENFAERGASSVPSQPVRSSGVLSFLLSEAEHEQELRSADGGAVSPTYGRQLAEPTKGAKTTFRLAPKGPKSSLSNRPEQIGRRRPAGWQKEGLELRAPQKRIASSIALRAKTPFGRNYVPVNRSATSKLWLRSNLKKQFGFFQFASHGLRAGPRRGFVRASRPNQPERSSGVVSFLLSEAEHEQERRSADGATRPAAVAAPVGLLAQPKGEYGLERLGVCVGRIEPLTNRSRAGALRSAKQSGTPSCDFTTFPLMMTKVPPLCLPTGLATLIPSPSQEYRLQAEAARFTSRSRAVYKPKPRGSQTFGLYRPVCTSRLVSKGLKSEPAASEVRRCFSAADLFGFNSGASVRREFPFQLATQAGTGFRLPPQGPKRLSILYSSNLDKMSFLSSDLANLSLSLKTYTFLKKKGKKNIASLLEYSPNTLFYLLNGDEKMFHEIERCLLFLGLPF